MWKAVKLTNRNVRRVKRDNPEKQSGVMHVKPAMQINLKLIVKIVLIKERPVKNVKRK